MLKKVKGDFVGIDILQNTAVLKVDVVKETYA